MIEKFNRLSKYLFFLCIITSVIFACNFFERESWKYTGEGDLTFDQNSILQDFSLGETNVFSLLEATPEIGYVRDTPPVHWSQTDYYQIAQAVSESVWKESLEGWNLNEMDFRLDCKDADAGPQRGIFIY